MKRAHLQLDENVVLKGCSRPHPRFILQRFLLKKHLHHTFTVYPVLVLALGAMFTKSYQALHISPNTVFCGTLSTFMINQKNKQNLLLSPFPVSSPGFLMLVVTIMSCFHLLCECLHIKEPSKPLATESVMRIDYCQTVYQFTESKTKPAEL